MSIMISARFAPRMTEGHEIRPSLTKGAEIMDQLFR